MRHEYQVKCSDSSIQATLVGRFGTSEYGKSKKAGEELLLPCYPQSNFGRNSRTSSSVCGNLPNVFRR